LYNITVICIIKTKDIYDLGTLSLEYCDSETGYPNFKALGLESRIYPTDVSIQILNAENASMNW